MLHLAQNMWLEGDSLAPFVVTPMANVLRALECAPCAGSHTRVARRMLTHSPTRPRSLAQVGPADTLLDVGCGDGRVVVRLTPRGRPCAAAAPHTGLTRLARIAPGARRAISRLLPAALTHGPHARLLQRRCAAPERVA